jgi:hypothetical protein
MKALEPTTPHSWLGSIMHVLSIECKAIQLMLVYIPTKQPVKQLQIATEVLAVIV